MFEIEKAIPSFFPLNSVISYIVKSLPDTSWRWRWGGWGVKPAPKATVPFSEMRSLHGASPQVSEENETKLTVTFTEPQTWKGPSRGSGNYREQFSEAEPEVSPGRIPARFLCSSSPAAAAYQRTQAIQLSLPSFSSPWGAPAEFLQRSAYRLLPFRSFTHTHSASFHKL